MPAPTLSERVEKLKESVSTLFTRADLADKDLTRIETVLGKTTDAVQDIATRLAAIEERLNESQEGDRGNRSKEILLRARASLCSVGSGVGSCRPDRAHLPQSTSGSRTLGPMTSLTLGSSPTFEV